MTLHVYNPNPNAFVKFMRRIYQPAGFKKGYNFVLFFIFAGTLFGFCLASLEKIDVKIFKRNAAPGLWYYYHKHLYKTGLFMHLGAILPAGVLVVWQFVPVIRHKALIFHRINGYLVLLCLLVGEAGAIIIAPVAFGGTFDTQVMVGVLAIMTIISASLAYINIKRLQIDQHRAWMLRCWFYMGSIITMRLVFLLATNIISARGGYFISMPCGMITQMGGDSSVYPNCATDPNGYTAVEATNTAIQGAAAGLNITFGGSGFTAIFMHAVGVEIYLHLTPAEGERLRKVSYDRQLERGFSHPGSSGLTSDRLGDAKRYNPSTEEGQSGPKSVDGRTSSDIVGA